MPFASATVSRHLLRGAVGLALAVAAFALLPVVGGISLALLIGTVAAWRGCPTCWLVGLAATRENAAACPVPSRRDTA